MSMGDWEPKMVLPDGKYIKYNNRTKRWYLYNPRGVLITSNKRKHVLLNWKESE